MTWPTNKGRKDLRCPFGCQEADKKRKANERSKNYYQTTEGKQKKYDINKSRSTKSRSTKSKTLTEQIKSFTPTGTFVESSIVIDISTENQPASKISKQQSSCSSILENPKNQSIFNYIQKITCLIESRFVSMEEIKNYIGTILRQQGLSQWGKSCYFSVSTYPQPP